LFTQQIAVDTPALMVDLDTLEANDARIAAAAKTAYTRETDFRDMRVELLTTAWMSSCELEDRRPHSYRKTTRLDPRS
jgi:hypothetical protein